MHFFQLLLGHLTNLDQTLQVASVDKTYQKLSPLRHTWWPWWCNTFSCFTIKPSSHYNFHIQFAIYSKLLKYVEGLVLNIYTWQTPMAACPDVHGLRGPVHCCLQLQFVLLGFFGFFLFFCLDSNKWIYSVKMHSENEMEWHDKLNSMNELYFWIHHPPLKVSLKQVSYIIVCYSCSHITEQYYGYS